MFVINGVPWEEVNVSKSNQGGGSMFYKQFCFSKREYELDAFLANRF